MSEEIDQAVNDFEKENKKFELALKVAEGDEAVAQKLLSGEIKNITAIKGSFKDPAVNLYGLFICFLHLDHRNIERNYAVVSFDESLGNIPPYLKWSELERKLIDFEWSGKNLANQSTDLKGDIQSTIMFEHLDKIIELIKEEKEKDIQDILSNVVSKSLNLESITLSVHVELTNTFFIEFEGHAKKEEEVEETDEDDAPIPVSDEVILDGMLEISPVRGIHITDLVPGITILVRLPNKTAKDKYYINLFNAFDGKKVQPVSAIVRNVDYDEVTGYLVIAEVTPGVVVKCIEQAQINVMTPEIADKDRKVRDTRMFIIMLGSFLLLLVAIYLYLYFKGII